MSINTLNIIKIIKQKLDVSTSEIAQLSTALLKLKDSTINTCSSYATLPNPIYAKGQLWLTNDTNVIYLSNAIQWIELYNQPNYLWSTGPNSYGALGDGTFVVKSSPVPLVTPANGWTWKQISEGGYFTVAIKSDDTAWSWGRNNYGQLGDNNGTVSSRSSPVSVIGGFTWKAVRSFMYHVAAIKSDDTIWTWGRNNYGQLGDNNGTVSSRSSPVLVVGGFTWKQVNGKGRHTIGIKSDNTIWAWGRNNYGQLGDNVGTVSSRSSPVSVVGGFTWKQSTGGVVMTAAIKSDDTLWAWGQNGYGQLGDNNGTVKSRSSPVSVVGGFTWKSGDGGHYHTAAIKSDNTLWAWGYNLYGELGDGSTSSRSSPVSVVGGFTWKSMCAGHYFTIGIKSDDTLWGWGINGAGQLGDNDGTVSSRSSPVSVVGGFTWKQVDNGYETIGIPIESYRN